MTETLGARVRAMRRRAGLSQGQLAALTGLTVQTVNRIELDRPQRVLRGTRDALAHALNVSPEYLETGREPGSSQDLPTLEFYLRSTANLTDEQISYVRRSVQAMEAERKLADLQAEYAAQQGEGEEILDIPGEPKAAQSEPEPPAESDEPA